MMRGLQISLGVHVQDPTELKATANSFYQELYASEGVQGVEDFINHVPCKLTPDMNSKLCAPYTADEVKCALFQMFPTKAPGLDDFPAQFYQKHWDVCGEDVTKIVLRIVRVRRALNVSMTLYWF